MKGNNTKSVDQRKKQSLDLDLPKKKKEEDIDLYEDANIEDVVGQEEKRTRDSLRPSLTADELTNIEIHRIKTERAAKFKNLRFAFIIFMLIVLVTLIVILNTGNGKSKGPIVIGPIDYKFEEDEEELDIKKELKNYYKKRDKSKLEEILVENYEDEKKIAEVNNTAMQSIDPLIKDIIITSKDNLEFNNKMNDLEEYVKSLNSIRYNSIPILKDNDLTTIQERIVIVKDKSAPYFLGLNYYNDKDYNNAYNTLNSIPEDDFFHQYAQDFISIITNDILALLNDEVDSLSTNLDYLNTAEKKAKYIQIKEIIEQYNRAYPYLNLENNSNYKELLEKYTELSR